QPVQTGEVKVRKDVRTEHQKIDVPVEREEVVVTRKPARGTAGAIGQTEEIRIPVKEEQVRVTKQTVPTEEGTVGRRKVRDVKGADETVRKEEVRVEDQGNARVRQTRTKKSGAPRFRPRGT